MEGRCLKVKNECKAMEDLENESYDKGMKNAAFDVAAKYYKKGLISLQEAAEDTGMQLEAFAVEVAKASSSIPMCKAIEEMRVEAAEEATRKRNIEVARSLLKKKAKNNLIYLTYEDISDTSHLTVAEIEQLAKKINHEHPRWGGRR